MRELLAVPKRERGEIQLLLKTKSGDALGCIPDGWWVEGGWQQITVHCIQDGYRGLKQVTLSSYDGEGPVWLHPD